MQRRLLLAAVAALASGSAALAQTETTVLRAESGPAQVDRTTQTEDVRYKKDAAERMTVPVLLSGHGPYRFLVDTGANRTAISREVASKLRFVSGEAASLARRRYLAAHPSAEAFVDFTDFAFFRIAPSGLHLVAGFGRIIDLKPAQFLTDISEAADLLETEASAVEHMNEDHREAMNLYATKLFGAEAADWRCSGCDPDGMDMQAEGRTLRLEFPERVRTGAELRKMLVRLAADALAKQ